MWDPGGKAWMFQGFLVLLGWESASVIHWSIAVRISYLPTVSAAEREDSEYPTFLFLFFIFYSLKAIYKNRNYTKGGSLFFFPWKVARLSAKRKRHVAQGLLAVISASAGLPVVTAKAKCHLCLEARVPHSSFVSLRCTRHVSRFVGLARRSPRSLKVIFQPEELGWRGDRCLWLSKYFIAC